MITKLFFIFLFVTHMGLQANQPTLSQYVPSPESIPEWKWAYNPQVYQPQNLFQYINGEAELYKDYSFKEMITTTYIHQTLQSKTITLDIYNMGSKLNAFGIYSYYRRPNFQFDSIGDEAIVSEYNIRFYKGHFYVQLNTPVNNKDAQNVMHTLAKNVAASIEYVPDPEELQLLPKENQIEHTLRYVAKGFLGLAAFEFAMQADYTVQHDTLTAFIMWKSNQTEADDALSCFKQNLEKRGKIQHALDDELIAQLPYHGKLMARRKNRFIVGAKGYENKKNALEIIQHIMAH